MSVINIYVNLNSLSRESKESYRDVFSYKRKTFAFNMILMKICFVLTEPEFETKVIRFRIGGH